MFQEHLGLRLLGIRGFAVWGAWLELRFTSIVLKTMPRFPKLGKRIHDGRSTCIKDYG